MTELSPAQIAVVEAIVTLFEQGKPIGGDTYATVTLIRNDSGGLTFGKHQVTRNSGNLGLLIEAYLENKDAIASSKAAIAPYLQRLLLRDPKLDGDQELRAALRLIGADPMMRIVQDKFFQEVYMGPAMKAAAALKIQTALGSAVVYDSFIHGSWGAMRDRTRSLVGTPVTVGEREWIIRYVATRRQWLATHSNPALHPTVYRMDCFNRLIGDNEWDLALPLRLQGPGGRIWNVTGAMLGVGDTEPEPAVPALKPSDAASAEKDDERRLLLLSEPPLVGEDIKRVQLVLNTRGYPVVANGTFDEQTQEAVIMFQKYAGFNLKPDGKVGPATRAAMGIND